jgi:hypothetical protein
MNPMQALQAKILELSQDPDVDPGVITLLKDRLRSLQEQADPASALARDLTERNEVLRRMTEMK